MLLRKYNLVGRRVVAARCGSLSQWPRLALTGLSPAAVGHLGCLPVPHASWSASGATAPRGWGSPRIDGPLRVRMAEGPLRACSWLATRGLTLQGGPLPRSTSRGLSSRACRWRQYVVLAACQCRVHGGMRWVPLLFASWGAVRINGPLRVRMVERPSSGVLAGCAWADTASAISQWHAACPLKLAAGSSTSPWLLASATCLVFRVGRLCSS